MNLLTSKWLTSRELDIARTTVQHLGETGTPRALADVFSRAGDPPRGVRGCQHVTAKHVIGSKMVCYSLWYGLSFFVSTQLLQ